MSSWDQLPFMVSQNPYRIANAPNSQSPAGIRPARARGSDGRLRRGTRLNCGAQRQPHADQEQAHEQDGGEDRQAGPEP